MSMVSRNKKISGYFPVPGVPLFVLFVFLGPMSHSNSFVGTNANKVESVDVIVYWSPLEIMDLRC